MAVTAVFLLDQGSGVENAHPQANRHALRRKPVSGIKSQDIDELQDAGVALSEEALILLKRASMSLGKRRRGSSRSIVAPLYKQLESLRNLVPHSKPSKETCVITDGIHYLERLRQQIVDLHSSLKLQQGHARTSTVEVTDVNQGLRIHVSCEKRQGLMADLMVVLETFGLVFDVVNASCHHILTLDAVSSQEGIDAIDKKSIMEELLKVIHCKGGPADEKQFDTEVFSQR